MQTTSQSHEGQDQSKSNDDRPIRYFVEGQVAVLAEHGDPDLSPQQVVQLVRREIARLLSQPSERAIKADKDASSAQTGGSAGSDGGATSSPIAGEHLLRALDHLPANMDDKHPPVLTFPISGPHPPFSL